MINEHDFEFEPGFVPPKNLQYFLLILKETKKVRGRTKLFKIHSLIEEEGRVKYNLPIDTYPLGPVDYETFNFCKEYNLIEDRLIQTSTHDYYETYLTKKGKTFFEKFCQPNMDEGEIRKALEIISRYRSMPGFAILAHVHKKYVDPFKDKERKDADISAAVNRISIISSIVRSSRGPQDDREVILSELRHLKEILISLKETSDPTKVGTILENLNKFFESLKISNYTREPLSIELFEFLDHYADKEGIQKSIASADFSDLSQEEREGLFRAIIEMDTPPMKAGQGEVHAHQEAAR